MKESFFLDKGTLTKGKDGHDFAFPSSKDFFAAPSNLIPAISSTSGGRVLLGAKASLQAVSLTHREQPLVQSTDKEGMESFHSKFGKSLLCVNATEPGTVTSINDSEIHVKGKGGDKVYELYDNYHLGRKSFIQHYPKVKVGDHVTKGQLLASSNYTDDKGHLALGVNLNTAVMPYRSGNFEDAWVVSETGAKKLEAEQLVRHRLEEVLGIIANKDKYVSLFPNKFLNAQLNTIDSDGVVKKGTKLVYGDPVILAVSPKSLKSTDIQLGKLSKVLKHAFKDNSQTWEYEHPGEVVDVAKTGGIITVNIKTVRGLSVGDKISVAWGNKGTVGKIASDTEVPTGPDGKPVDIILNSMSVTSRIAPAVLVALGMGKVARKTGRPVNLPHFVDGSAVQHTIDALKKHGLSDVETLYDPLTKQHMEVLYGPLNCTRLAHIAEDKESSRSQGGGYDFQMQPTKSGTEVSKRIGNLATSALLSHGAGAVLRDIATVKSTKNDEYWRRLKLGMPVSSPEVPFIFHKFIASLEGAGVKVDKKGPVFNIFPQTDKDVDAKTQGKIKNPLTFKVKQDALIPEDGGLFDPSIVGILGNRWNHIDLHSPVPNPISEDYIRKLLGVTKAAYEKLIVDGEIGKKLQEIDVDKKIAEYKAYLKSGKKTDRENSIKCLEFLMNLKEHGLTPKNLMLNKIAVLPAQFRPTTASDGRLMTADVNTLYKELMLINNSLKNVEHLPDDLKGKLKKEQYDAVKAVYGLGEPISVKSKEKGLKGLLASTLGISGGSGKTTMFQAKVVNKPVELVGRAVLAPDANLGLDEAFVPQDTLWKAYLPFIIKRMVQRGVPATKALEYAQNRNPLAHIALMEELKERPGIISRDPVLHKYNLTGFFLRPNPDGKDKTIKLNPLVFKSFNADNDGDQLNVNVPATQEASDEIKSKMLPSRNLVSPKNFMPMYTPSNEAALGLFQSSTETSNKPIAKYKTEADVIRDYTSGKLSPGDRVEIG